MYQEKSPRSWSGARINSPRQFINEKRDRVKSLARGQWREILSTVGISTEFLSNHHGPCPGCAGTDRFRFDDKDGNGTWFCNANQPHRSGDGFSLIQHVYGWNFSQALNTVATVLGVDGEQIDYRPKLLTVPTEQFSPDNPDPKAVQYNEWLWSESKIIEPGCPADLYLQSRCLGLSEYPDVLKWHPGLNYKDRETLIGKFPAMVASVQDASGKIIALHRTFLTESGQKAPVTKQKKLTQRIYSGALRGAAIKLSEPLEILCLSEGIETALAMQLIFQQPAWAGISDSGMVDVMIPHSVKQLIIGVDNDDAGRNALGKLVQKYRGSEVEVLSAPASKALDRLNSDWADVWKEIYCEQ